RPVNWLLASPMSVFSPIPITSRMVGRLHATECGLPGMRWPSGMGEKTDIGEARSQFTGRRRARQRQRVSCRGGGQAGLHLGERNTLQADNLMPRFLPAHQRDGATVQAESFGEKIEENVVGAAREGRGVHLDLERIAPPPGDLIARGV